MPKPVSDAVVQVDDCKVAASVPGIAPGTVGTNCTVCSTVFVSQISTGRKIPLCKNNRLHSEEQGRDDGKELHFALFRQSSESPSSESIRVIDGRIL